MIDTEVVRLRNLRNAAMQTRALAHRFIQCQADDAEFQHGALLCWALVRVASGRLRAHPYASYQKGRSEVRNALEEAAAGVTAALARQRDHVFGTFAAQLERLLRELADVRALTWSTDFSDDLGRTERRLRTLVKEVAVRASRERPAGVARAPAAVPVTLNEVAAADWPYLAI